MCLINSRQQLLAHQHHFGIEVPDPVHLDGFVWERRLPAHLIIADDDGTFHAFALMLRHYTED